MHHRVTLPNGIRILTERMPYVRSVSIAYYFGVGSRYESAEMSGVSHLIEHMLFKGSERYPTAQRISESIEGVGGVLDAATDKELTTYSAKIASRHFDLAMNLLSDMVRYPRLAPEELEKERQVIIEELNMYRDSPQEWVSVLGDETVWPNLPLGREVAGTRETVSSITRSEMDRYRLSHYVPGNLVLSVVGDITNEQVVETATRLLGDWLPAPIPEWAPCPPPQDVKRVRVEQRKTEQTNFCLYTRGLPHNSPDYYVEVILNAILGDGMSSRLFNEVREQRGLAYDVSSSPANYYDTGSFVIYAGVEPKRALPAIEAILHELQRTRCEVVSAEELDRAKEYTKGRLALRLEDTYSVASWLGGQEALLGEVRELDDILERIDDVTQEDVQRLAQSLFTDEWLRLAVIGPHKALKPFEDVLHL